MKHEKTKAKNIHAKKISAMFFIRGKKKTNEGIGLNNYDSGRELDFLASREGRGFDRNQVAMTLTPVDERRELGAFALADPHLASGENLLLSLDETEESRDWQGVTIRRRHLIKWLLSGIKGM